MNTLPDQDVMDVTGLTPIVDKLTRAINKLDRIYVSNPICYDNVKVVICKITAQ